MLCSMVKMVDCFCVVDDVLHDECAQFKGTCFGVHYNDDNKVVLTNNQSCVTHNASKDWNPNSLTKNSII